MQLDFDAARDGIAALAKRLNLTGPKVVDEMAQGILSLAAFTMSSAVRQITMERGIAPRQRDRDTVLADLRNGYITQKATRNKYGIAP